MTEQGEAVSCNAVSCNAASCDAESRDWGKTSATGKALVGRGEIEPLWTPIELVCGVAGDDNIAFVLGDIDSDAEDVMLCPTRPCVRDLALPMRVGVSTPLRRGFGLNMNRRAGIKRPCGFDDRGPDDLLLSRRGAGAQWHHGGRRFAAPGLRFLDFRQS